MAAERITRLQLNREGQTMAAAPLVRVNSRLGGFAGAALAVLAAAVLSTFSGPAYAMKIQKIKSPGGIEAWLVEEHSVPMKCGCTSGWASPHW